MKKRSYKKRYTKKRRVFKRKSFKKRYGPPKPDGMVCYKIHGIQDHIWLTATGNSACTVVNWAGNGTAASTNTIRLTVQNEFTNYANDYNEYRVIGCKMRLIPLQAISSTLDQGWFYTEMGSDTRVLPPGTTADNTMRSYVDYKLVKGNNQAFKYVSTTKFFYSKSIKWLSTTANYPDAGTLFRTYTTGIGNNVLIGKMMVTWYVQFKAPQL